MVHQLAIFTIWLTWEGGRFVSRVFFVSIDEASSASRALAAFSFEEATSTRAIALFLLSSGATQTEQDDRNEEADKRCPLETESVLANLCGLSVVAEVVAAFDVGSSVRLLALEGMREDCVSRHESNLDSLKESGNHGEEAAEVCSNPRAQRQNAGEQSADPEEQCN